MFDVKKQDISSTKRIETLNTAKDIICGEREGAYGKPENNFKTIASFWSTYLGIRIQPYQVANMMTLLKVARIKSGHYKNDNYVDAAGYIALASELQEGESK